MSVLDGLDAPGVGSAKEPSRWRDDDEPGPWPQPPEGCGAAREM